MDSVTKNEPPAGGDAPLSLGAPLPGVPHGVGDAGELVADGFRQTTLNLR
jgi:hypothetical protein